MRTVQPERALRLLDSLDGLACAARLAWEGYWGRRVACLLIAFCLITAVARLTALLH